MYDIVIKNGLVIFGGEKECTITNIGITGDKITYIGDEEIEGEKEIEAVGNVVCPGFVDIHAHSELVPFTEEKSISKLMQGITTEINGNCGFSAVPVNQNYLKELEHYIEKNLEIRPKNYKFQSNKNLKEFKKAVEEKGCIVNQGYLVGGGTLRIAVKGYSSSKATKEEMVKMKELLEEEFKAGAYGISFGLIYPPGSFTMKDEIIEICEIVKKYDKIAVFHMRGEGISLFKSIEEIIEISKESKVKTHISHLKILNKDFWGKGKEVIEIINNANKEGAQITFDQYPYSASSTTLKILIPSEYFKENIEEMIEEILKNKEAIEKIEKRILKRGGSDRIVISSTNGIMKEIENKTLEEIAIDLGVKEVEALMEIIRKTKGEINGIFFSMSENDVNLIVNYKDCLVASDGYSYPMENTEKYGNPHPRSFGTFPKYLRRVIDNNIVTLEEAINKVSYLPAKIFNIDGRGELKIGNYADITIFAIRDIDSRSDFKAPYMYPEGIEYVIINGKISIINNDYENLKNGIVI